MVEYPVVLGMSVSDWSAEWSPSRGTAAQTSKNSQQSYDSLFCLQPSLSEKKLLACYWAPDPSTPSHLANSSQ